MAKTSWYLVSSLCIVTFIIGLTGGYFLSPVYQQTMFEKTSMDMGPADRWIDLRYLTAMTAHHRGAMLLATQAQIQSQRPEIKTLAAEILANEPKLIDELSNWKKSWYNDPRPVADPAVANLGNSDETFDLRFLNALIAHHDAGIIMTTEIRTKSSRTEVLNNADAVENFLTTTGEQLRTWRKDWYAVQ